MEEEKPDFIIILGLHLYPSNNHNNNGRWCCYVGGKNGKLILLLHINTYFKTRRNRTPTPS